MVPRQEESLDNEIAAYRSLVFASSTKQVYSSQLKSYLRFCVYFNYELVPASTVQICRYAVFLARTLKPSSVRQYLNIVRLLHVENGYDNPMRDNWKISSLLKGIERAKGSPQPKNYRYFQSIFEGLKTILIWKNLSTRHFGQHV